MALEPLRLDVYGLWIDVSLAHGDPAGDGDFDVLGNLGKDFYFFRRHVDPARPGPRVELRLHLTTFDRTALPPLGSVGLTPRNYFYAHGHTLYADYFNKAFTVYDRSTRSLDVYTLKTAMAYEIAYLFILSQTGLHLDSIHMHRVHGLGISYRGKGCLLLLPSGGGKSTHGYKLLANPEVRILSEDSPVLDRNLRMHAFPTRIGINPADLGEPVAPEHIRTIERMEFSPKTVIDITCFEDKLELNPVRLETILIGKRFLGDHAAVRRAGRLRGFKALLTKMVIGIGLYQGLEYLMHRGTLSALKLMPTFVRRLFLAVRLCLATRIYVCEMGCNVERNVKTIEEFLKTEHDSHA
jgi:hypothetical protein